MNRCLPCSRGDRMNENVFEKFPILETRRLLLREVVNDDLDMIFSFNADPDALRFVARDYYTEKNEAVIKRQSLQAGFHENTGIIWTFILKETRASLGYGGYFDIAENRIEAEIGYGILKEFWGQGYVSEAVEEMTRFGFDEMHLQRVFGRVDPKNIPSAHILQKLGYQNEGVKVDDEFARGRFFDMTIWARENQQ